jgi:hypothetical protein
MMEANVGYSFNFFACSVNKGEFSCQFLRDEYGQKAFIIFKYVEGVRRRNYEIFQGMKVFTNDKSMWVIETEFLRRYKSRIPDTKVRIYDRYVEKYKTIFSWLCIAFNGKEKFWEILKRDYENNNLDCYEVRLEEIVNTCTSNDIKY